MNEPKSSPEDPSLISSELADKIVAEKVAPTPGAAEVAPSVLVEKADSIERPVPVKLPGGLESIESKKLPVSDGEPLVASTAPSSHEKIERHAAQDDATKLEQTM